MIVQCPQCQARYRLDERHFAERSQVKVRCTQCQLVFPVDSPQASRSAPDSEQTVVNKASRGPQMPPGKSVALSVTQGPMKGKVFSVTKPRVTLGRAGTDIVIDDPEVSRRHCALEVHLGTAMLVDLGSTNGTFVNDERVETHELEHLSEFRLGNTTLMLTITENR